MATKKIAGTTPASKTAKKTTKAAGMNGAAETKAPKAAAKKAAAPTAAALNGAASSGAASTQGAALSHGAGQRREPSHAEIAHLAHRYWEERGHHHGSHVADWIRAEQELRGA